MGEDLLMVDPSKILNKLNLIQISIENKMLENRAIFL